MDDDDKKLAAEHKALWDAGDFAAAANCMRAFRAKYGNSVRQESDGIVAQYASQLKRFNFNTQQDEMFSAEKGWVNANQQEG